jgi:dolichol-phosphate mannosyltransferase
MLTIDLVIPVFNEGAALRDFQRALAAALTETPYSFRFFYIDDGSTDDSPEILAELARADARIQAIRLSRNFGHQAALSAGLDAANGDAVIMMDGDGQHPPELLPEMLRLFESGYDIVQTQRLDSGGNVTILKSLTSRLFYRLINRLGETRIIGGAADFRLLSGEAARALRQLPEYHRFYRGMVQWIGFRSVILPYIPATRIAGHSKYSFRKMLRLAADGMFSFSLAPLRLGLLIGVLFFCLAAAEILFVLSYWVRGATSSLVPGWSSLMLVLIVSSGISMLLTGILGIYIGMIFQEVKRRPLYLVKDCTAVARVDPRPEREPGSIPRQPETYNK